VIDTKQKIMDTAVRVFAEQGYGGTSLRHIIAEAQVNLAAIHYHFGSKEELLDAAIARNIEPVNAERLDRLTRLEERAVGKPVAVDEILEAFLAPTMVVVKQNPEFPRMMGRLIGEGLMPDLASRHFAEVGRRFWGALRRALPDLTESELAWRLNFLIGAMAHCLCRGPLEWQVPLDATLDPAHMVKELVTFLTAGFRAPSALSARATSAASGQRGEQI
jgi:AcrR family transcriptional regulator